MCILLCETSPAAFHLDNEIEITEQWHVSKPSPDLHKTYRKLHTFDHASSLLELFILRWLVLYLLTTKFQR